MNPDAGPQGKRPRSSAGAMDHTNSEPNLKTLFSFAKLEKWVSASENNQRLIETLTNKLADGEMEALKENLKVKKLKKSLCFSFSDIKKIYSNQKLQSFFDDNQAAKFPDLALSLFFEKDRDQVENVQNPDEKDNASLECNTVDMEFEAESASEGGAVGKKRGPNSTGSKMAKQYQLLREWVKNKGHTEEEAKNILGYISIENQVEHREYPCFIAEKVMVYADPRTGERQIIAIDEKNAAAKKALPKEIRTLLIYQMWVCGVQTAVLIGQEGKVINYDPAFSATITLCERLVFEAFAPSLAVFKRMQRERLNSLIGNH